MATPAESASARLQATWMLTSSAGTAATTGLALLCLVAILCSLCCCCTLAHVPDPGISVHFRCTDDEVTALHVRLAAQPPPTDTPRAHQQCAHLAQQSASR